MTSEIGLQLSGSVMLGNDTLGFTGRSISPLGGIAVMFEKQDDM